MAFITVAGENQIALKQGNAQVLTMANFVLANIPALGAEPVDRIEAMPDAGNIVATLPVTASGYVNSNQVVYSLVMDSTVGDFDFNWIGLVDAENVLIAVTYSQLIEKRATAGAVQGNNMTRNFLLSFSGIQATAAISVPAETWQIDFTTRLIQIDDREAVANTDVFGANAFFNQSFNVFHVESNTFRIAQGVGYVNGYRVIQGDIDFTLSVPVKPMGIWLDVSMQGDISGRQPVLEYVQNAGNLVDYTDGNGFQHHVVKIADIAADNTVTDLRDVVQSLLAHQADADPHPQYFTDSEFAAHLADADPHPVYTSTAEAQTIAQQIEDLGMANHLADANPHPEYTTPIQVQSAAEVISNQAVVNHVADANPHPSLTPLVLFGEHLAAADPHTGYVLESKVKHGRVAEDGTFAGSSGIVSSRTSTARYQVTHNLNSLNYTPIVIAYLGPGEPFSGLGVPSVGIEFEGVNHFSYLTYVDGVPADLRTRVLLLID